MHEWQSLSHVKWDCKYHVVYGQLKQHGLERFHVRGLARWSTVLTLACIAHNLMKWRGMEEGRAAALKQAASYSQRLGSGRGSPHGAASSLPTPRGSWYPKRVGEVAMNVKLDPKDEKDLEALAREAGKDPGVLLRELLHDAISERKRNGSTGDEEALARKQREAFKQLHAELDALPPEGFPEPDGRPVSERPDEFL